MTASPVPDALVAHLRSWAGGWPPRVAAPGVDVVAHPGAALPRWDGQHAPALGAATETGQALLGVDPVYAPAVAAVATGTDLPGVLAALPDLLGRSGIGVQGVLRWSLDPAPLPDVGVWLPHDDPRVPEWLRPFGGDVLVVLEADAYVAGVGLKRHDAYGHEIAVGTEEAARGRGLARRLVAQAARRIVDEGRVALYHHAPDNHASARAADAAGFPDRGWSVLAFFPRP